MAALLELAALAGEVAAGVELAAAASLKQGGPCFIQASQLQMSPEGEKAQVAEGISEVLFGPAAGQDTGV